VTQVSRQISKRDNSEWGKITVEDFHGTATILAFKEAWQAARELLVPDAVVLIHGAVSGRERDEEDPPVFLDSVESLDDLPDSGQLALRIELAPEAKLPEGAFAKARTVLERHPGRAPVEVTVGQDNGVPAPRLRSKTLRTDPVGGGLEELRAIFGRGRVRLVRTGVAEFTPG
jgi:DNA polymerase-3 subunit alpha